MWESIADDFVEFYYSAWVSVILEVSGLVVYVLEYSQYSYTMQHKESNLV